MKKIEFIKAIAEKTGFTQADIRSMIDAVQAVVYENISTEEIPLIDGLKVYSSVRPARVGRNPRSGESIEIPEKRVPKAKIGTALKNVIA